MVALVEFAFTAAVGLCCLFMSLERASTETETPHPEERMSLKKILSRASLTGAAVALAATLGASSASAQRPDFNGDGIGDLAVGANGRDDLAIGVPGEALGGKAGAGVVNVLYGRSAGLSATANQLWHQDTAEIEDQAEEGDRFGGGL